MASRLIPFNHPLSLDDLPGALIELQGVHKTFKTTAGEFPALKNVHLRFDKGEFTAIMGKSGSGKSTLINMITGIDHPSAGTVRVGGVEIHHLNEGQLAEWRGRTLGIVFQFFQLLPTLTVLENTLLPMDYCNMFDPGEREERALGLLRLLGLEDVADKLPAALSGGQQQVAAIARSLANDPPILVADEPTGNLDSRTAQQVLGIFDTLAGQGKTIVIVTHDAGLARRAARRVLISDGELVDERVAQAMPMLTHPQMLKLGRLATPRRAEAGALIARQGALDEGLYVVTAGQVEVARHQRLRSPEVVGQLVAGQYFCSLDLMETQACDLLFRAAAEAPVEMLCVTLGQFSQWLAENPTAEAALRRAAAEQTTRYCPEKRSSLSGLARPLGPRSSSPEKSLGGASHA